MSNLVQMRLVTFVLSAFAILLFARCDGGEDGVLCLTVTPEGNYVLSGTAGAMNFIPASMTYTVTNSCSGDIELSVIEDVRWLDVDIAAFGGGGNESGTLTAGQSVSVVVEVRYGTDDPERLDQLSAGDYSAGLHFDDDTNDDRVSREVNVSVTPAPASDR